MKKKVLAIAAMLFAAASWAAIDANTATEAELDGLKGVGPALTKRIIQGRTESPYKDWPDFMSRVKGVKDKAATKLSAEGLTVNGRAFGAPAPAAPAAKNEVKAGAKKVAAEPAKPAAKASTKP